MINAIALVDCNSFYCSCERLFRPDLRNHPVGVLSNNDGCFVSLTPELKALGVKMGVPYFEVKDLCHFHQVAVFSANFSLYTNLSDRVMMTLAQFTPEMQIYSVDEAFLNLNGFERRGLKAYATQIKTTVERTTGIPVSLGIAPTKTLAKVANRLAKKNKIHAGVLSLMDEDIQDWALTQTPVEDIWGIGRQNSLKLKTLGIKTAKDFRDYKNDQLIQSIFTKVGRMTQDELRGIPCFELDVVGKKKQEIISSRSFGAPVFELKALREAVANYTSLASEKLRAQGSICAAIEVSVRTNPFKDVVQYQESADHVFNVQTNDTRKLIKYALQVLDRLYQEGYEYKKAMVRISGIRDEHQAQLSLFEPSDDDNAQRLMKVMDKINRKEGDQAVKFAACGVDNKAWKMRQTLKSPRYLSSWGEIPKAKCL